MAPRQIQAPPVMPVAIILVLSMPNCAELLYTCLIALAKSSCPLGALASERLEHEVLGQQPHGVVVEHDDLLLGDLGCDLQDRLDYIRKVTVTCKA